ncbi:MAG: hypothetical protein ACTS1X_03975 [Parasphingopyxis sp.]|uniref:hypothetical protein n=1 Tax=Parasphingopyxis sp. TaxID=1920299 RepID=UPI003FA0C90C
MKANFPHPPQHVLEMLYHRHLGYGLGQSKDTFWGFRTAFDALELSVSDEELDRYRSHFIEMGWGQFDGKKDPNFAITSLGEEAARQSIARRKPIFSARRLRTYDWPIYGSAAAIIAALFSIAAFYQG